MPGRQEAPVLEETFTCIRLLRPNEDVKQLRQHYRDAYTQLARSNGYRLNDEDLNVWWPGTEKRT